MTWFRQLQVESNKECWQLDAKEERGKDTPLIHLDMTLRESNLEKQTGNKGIYYGIGRAGMLARTRRDVTAQDSHQNESWSAFLPLSFVWKPLLEINDFC